MDIDKLTKLVLIVAILIITLSVAYYFVIFMPQKERAELSHAEEQQAMEQQEAELEKKEQEKREKELQDCLFNAYITYVDNWLRSCETIGVLTDDCKPLVGINYNEYAEQNDIDTYKQPEAQLDFYKKKEACSCSLPSATSERWDELQQRLNDACYKKYPTN